MRELHGYHAWNHERQGGAGSISRENGEVRGARGAKMGLLLIE
jgi:hypothetical protein